jgi:hypothetical protein
MGEGNGRREWEVFDAVDDIVCKHPSDVAQGRRVHEEGKSAELVFIFIYRPILIMHNVN